MTGSLRRRTARPLFALVLPLAAAALGLPGRGALAADEPPAYYAVEVVVAPVCLEGTFPLVITTAAGDLTGLLEVETDVAGKITGTYTVGGKTFRVAGTVSQSAADGGTVRFTAKSGKNRVSFTGTLQGETFVGTAKGKGSTAPGSNPATLDVSSSSPQTATIQFSVVPGRSGKVGGKGFVTSCGDTVKLKVSGKRTTELAVDLKGKKLFRFQATGTGDGSGLLVGWTASGFGAEASGDALAVPPLAPPAGITTSLTAAMFEVDQPIDPVTVTGGTNPLGSYSVAPALPRGLSVDPATGTISGTPSLIRPAATYTLTAENLAGTASATLQLGTRADRSLSFAKETGPLTTDDVRHFLTRTRFGVTAADEAAVSQAGGFEQALDAMLVFESGTPVETAALVELLNTDPNLPPELIYKFPSSTQVARWWEHLMVNNPNPFQEVLAFFWHDHFSVSSENMSGSQMYYMVDYVNLYRHQGNGNLRDLLIAMARDPAMLYYLDGFRNTARAPNENFGREFWELFTLGVDNGYTQDDIVAASKAWSGWRERSQTYTSPIVPTTTYTLNYMQFDTTRHDPNPKYFLGVTIPGQNVTDDYAAVVDATLANRPVAEFIVRKLFEHFCYDDPPAALVATMAADLRAANWEIGVFLRKLFESEAFFSKKARRSRVKNPVEFGVGFMRTTGLRIPQSTLDSGLVTLGQRPTQPPTVNGWPLGSLWLSSQQMADRTNLAYTIVEHTSDQGGIAGAELSPAMPPVGQRSALEVVDHFAALMRVQLTEEDRTALVQYLNTVRNTNGSLTASPFDGNSGAHIDERVRGLLLILSQHPTYHLR